MAAHGKNIQLYLMDGKPRILAEKIRPEYIKRNTSRDRDVQNQLKADGWNVIVVWECELSRKADREERLRRLEREIRESGGKQ